jgi:hypothetical protein
MNKHPIDELFAKKLAEHSQEPSSKAFEKFQERLAQREQKRKGGFVFFNSRWSYFMAAASILIALSIAFFSPDKKASRLSHFTEKSIKKHQKESKRIEKPFILTKKIKASKPKFLKKPNVQKTIETASENLAQTTYLPAATPAKEEVEMMENSPMIASIEKIETHTPKEIILVYDEIQEHPSITQTILTEEKTDEKSFISKLFNEYQHFKYGEKVDLAKLGIKKREVLASVDEKLFKEEREDVRNFMQKTFGKNKKNNYQ